MQVIDYQLMGFDYFFMAYIKHVHCFHMCFYCVLYVVYEGVMCGLVCLWYYCCCSCVCVFLLSIVLQSALEMHTKLILFHVKPTDCRLDSKSACI